MDINPDSERVLYNKAYALTSLGHALQWEHGVEAIEILTEAAELFERITINTPKNIEAHDAYANALMKLSKVQFIKTTWKGAIETCKRAVLVYDKALAIAPEAIGSLNNKGRALQMLGQLSAVTGKFSEAVQFFKESLAVFDMSLAKAPDDARILREKELVNFQLIPMESAINNGTLMDGMITVYEPFESLEEREKDSDKDESL